MENILLLITDMHYHIRFKFPGIFTALIIFNNFLYFVIFCGVGFLWVNSSIPVRTNNNQTLDLFKYVKILNWLIEADPHQGLKALQRSLNLMFWKRKKFWWTPENFSSAVVVVIGLLNLMSLQSLFRYSHTLRPQN